VGNREVVRDEHQGGIHFRAQGPDEFERLLGAEGIEGTGRLVGKYKLRAIRQCAGDGNALLLADGHLARLVRKSMREPDAIEEVRGPVSIGAPAGEGHAKENIFER
jgi:hypothetical protein